MINSCGINFARVCRSFTRAGWGSFAEDVAGLLAPGGGAVWAAVVGVGKLRGGGYNVGDH